jgi:cytochrome c oxidase subunit 3
MSAATCHRADLPGPETEFQYPSAREQHDTSMTGMWLFLATETLFFGGLFLIWLYYRYLFPVGFALATRQTEFAVGTVNSVLLITSSVTYACGVAAIRNGDRKLLFKLAVATAALGVIFMLLKGVEWYLDIHAGMVPGPGFALRGPGSQGAALFWIFYYLATVLHAMHLMIGLGLVTWIALRARNGTVTRESHASVEIVGLYWSFVDMVWLVLYPMIYLAGRAG